MPLFGWAAWLCLMMGNEVLFPWGRGWGGCSKQGCEGRSRVLCSLEISPSLTDKELSWFWVGCVGSASCP